MERIFTCTGLLRFTALITSLMTSMILILKTRIMFCRGEKAFCSLDCRSEEILIDEEMEKVNNGSESTIEPNSSDEVLDTGLFIAT